MNNKWFCQDKATVSESCALHTVICVCFSELPQLRYQLKNRLRLKVDRKLMQVNVTVQKRSFTKNHSQLYFKSTDSFPVRSQCGVSSLCLRLTTTVHKHRTRDELGILKWPKAWVWVRMVSCLSVVQGIGRPRLKTTAPDCYWLAPAPTAILAAAKAMNEWMNQVFVLERKKNIFISVFSDFCSDEKFNEK